MPEVTACLWDTKKEVASAARSALEKAFELCGNRDIEAVLPKLARGSRRKSIYLIRKRKSLSVGYRPVFSRY